MAQFQLIDLTSNASFTFRYFPVTVRTEDRVNWEPQDLASGRKPLFYANRDGMSISVPELYLDGTDTDRNIKPDLDDLRLLMEEIDGTGMPPPLMAIWGAHKERCVMSGCTIEENMFNHDGEVTRAKISLELMELQPDGEATTVRVPTYNEDVQPGG
jgi:hypothetical protein